jgi:hypothetical protein
VLWLFMTNYRSSPILRAYWYDLEARVNINRSLRRIDLAKGQDGIKARAQWRTSENEMLRSYAWRAHRALYGVSAWELQQDSL